MADQIFISYRRDDAAYVTGHINDLLRKEFGDEAVFTDVDNIALGVDFRAVLDETVSQCQVFLAVIGSEWLTVRNQDGQKRLDDPADFVRIEIESALKRNIPVIPLLVAGATMPTEEELPESIKALAFRNGTQIRPPPDFSADMARLIKNLQKHFAGGATDVAASPAKQAAAKEDVQRQRPAKQRKSAGLKVEVAQEDLARHRADVEIGKQQKRKSWFARVGLAVVVVAAGAGLYYLGGNPDTLQSVLPESGPVESQDIPAAAEEVPIDPVDMAPMEESEQIDAEPEADLSAGATFGPAEAADELPELEAEPEQETEAEQAIEPESAAVTEPEEPEAAESAAAEPQPVYEEVVQTPDSAELIGEGVRLAAIGEHEAAIQNFDEAIELYSERSFYYKQRGASYQALGQFEAAIKDFDEAIRLSSEDVNAYYRRGVSHLSLQQYEAALADFDFVIEFDPEYVTAYSRRAEAHEAMGNTEAAERDRAAMAELEAN